MTYTHFSARVPGSDHILINPYGLMFDEITASSLVKIDHPGKVVDYLTGLGNNSAGFVIHGACTRRVPRSTASSTRTREQVSRWSVQKCWSAADQPACTAYLAAC